MTPSVALKSNPFPSSSSSSLLSISEIAHLLKQGKEEEDEEGGGTSFSPKRRNCCVCAKCYGKESSLAPFGTILATFLGGKCSPGEAWIRSESPPPPVPDAPPKTMEFSVEEA